LGPTTGTGEQYAVAMGELWSGLARTLARIDVIAGEPTVLEKLDATQSLRRLQYALHLASEHAYGLTPPPGAVTAQLEGAAGVEPLLHEWRGALFRVRLARLRVATPAPAPIVEPDDNGGTGVARPLVAFLFALIGAVTLVAGATLGLWPVWALGLLVVGSSVLVYRP
jgi:hypothetical protein